MSLSPWDLSGTIGFDFNLYRPRRPSYVFATQAARQRNESYRHATKHSTGSSSGAGGGGDDHGGSRDVSLGGDDGRDEDYIKNMVDRKARKESYKSACKHHRALAGQDGGSAGGGGGGAAIGLSVSDDYLDVEMRVGVEGSKQNHMGDACQTGLYTSRGIGARGALDGGEEEDNAFGSSSTSPSRVCCWSGTGRTLPTKNLLVLSIGFVLVFTAFRALQNLQTSLNVEGRLGSFSLCFIHSTMFITCLYAPAVISRLTAKWTVALGLFFYLTWIAAGFAPHFMTLIPAAICAGFGQSLAWTAQVTYMRAQADIRDRANRPSRLAGLVSRRRASAPPAGSAGALYRYNGVFLAFFQTSHIWGNLASSLILWGASSGVGEGVVGGGVEGEGETSRWAKWPAVEGAASCGIYDEMWTVTSWNVTASVSKAPALVRKLLTVYLVLAGVGFLLVLLLLDRVPRSASSSGSSSSSKAPTGAHCSSCCCNKSSCCCSPSKKQQLQAETMKTTTKTSAEDVVTPIACGGLKIIKTSVGQMTNNRLFCCLIPLLVFNGFEQAFIYADYNKSYISCTVGIEYIGYNMITLGLTNSIFSCLVGAVSRHIPREALIGIGSVLHIGLMVFLLVWIPDNGLLPVFFVISGLWGLCDAIWQTQTNSLVNLCCTDEDQDLAFLNLRLLQSLGAAIEFLLGSVSSGVAVKLYILITVLIVSVLCYVLIEYRLRKADPNDSLNEDARDAKIQADLAAAAVRVAVSTRTRRI